jgi:hypothetical protein
VIDIVLGVFDLFSPVLFFGLGFCFFVFFQHPFDAAPLSPSRC